MVLKYLREEHIIYGINLFTSISLSSVISGSGSGRGRGCDRDRDRGRIYKDLNRGGKGRWHHKLKMPVRIQIRLTVNNFSLRKSSRENPF